MINKIREELKEIKKEETAALYNRDEEALMKAFKKYDAKFKELLGAHETAGARKTNKGRV